MPVRIVDLLESIDVEQNHGGLSRRRSATCSLNERFQLVVDEGLVVQLREPVAHGEFVELRDHLGDLDVVAHLDVGHQQAVRHILDQLEHKLGALYVHRHAGYVKHATVEVLDLEHGVLHRQASARRAVETRIVLVPQLVAGTVDLDQTIPIAVVREHRWSRGSTNR